MKVLFKDKFDNLSVVEATSISVDNDEGYVVMMLADVKFPFICKDQDLVKNFERIIRRELDSAYVNFDCYTFARMSTEDIVKTCEAAFGQLDELQDKLDSIFK